MPNPYIFQTITLDVSDHVVVYKALKVFQQFKGITGSLRYRRITPTAYRKVNKPEDHEHEEKRVGRDRTNKRRNPRNGLRNDKSYIGENGRNSDSSL